MKRFRIYYLGLLLSALPCFITNAQEGTQLHSPEKTIIMTDRATYIAGENILFSAVLFDSTENVSGKSKILYSEIVTPDANKIAAAKTLVSDRQCQGCIAIPDDILTGYYYLRAYTRTMRNKGPASFSYCLIKILNPDNASVLNGRNHDSIRMGSLTDNNSSNDAFHLEINKSVFPPRDTVVLRIQRNTSQSSVVACNVSVIPEKAYFNQSVEIPAKNGYNKDKIFYPESRGLTLTGNVSRIADGKPSQGTRVSLVIIGQGRDFMSASTDQKGNFYFSLPDYYGTRDLLLSAEAENKDSLKLQVDNDFCPLTFKTPSPTFTVSEEERPLLLQMANNVKLAGIFPQDSLIPAEENTDFNKPFYGRPDETVRFDNYVQLASMEEYFNEIVMYAKVRKSRGKPYFRVIGQQPDLNKYPPLVMIDWVAIDDPEKILAISPQNIDRIEVVNNIYIKGNYSYGGIISIISKNGDFAGIELPSSALFINYRFLSQSCFTKPNDLYPHYPDTRNTLYWEPRLALQDNEVTEIKFSVADSPGHYIINFRSVLDDGKIIQKTMKFQVSR